MCDLRRFLPSGPECHPRPGSVLRRHGSSGRAGHGEDHPASHEQERGRSGSSGTVPNLRGGPEAGGLRYWRSAASADRKSKVRRSDFGLEGVVHMFFYWQYKKLHANWCYAVKPVLRDHCHNRPPVLKDQTFSTSQGPIFQHIEPGSKHPLYWETTFYGWWVSLSKQVSLYLGMYVVTGLGIYLRERNSSPTEPHLESMDVAITPVCLVHCVYVKAVMWSSWSYEGYPVLYYFRIDTSSGIRPHWSYPWAVLIWSCHYITYICISYVPKGIFLELKNCNLETQILFATLWLFFSIMCGFFYGVCIDLTWDSFWAILRGSPVRQ